MSETPPVVLQSPAGPEVEIDGRRLLFLGGTNYLGLNHDPDVVEALQRGAERWGISSSGSRTTTGTAAPHLELERWIRRFLDVEAAVLTGSAYPGNWILVQALGEEFGGFVIDEHAHSSLRDAALLAAKPHALCRHRDAGHVRELVARFRADGTRPLIMSDAVFPTSGLLAPLDTYHEIALEHDAGLLVDDAHGFGVLGEGGRGTPAHLGVPHGDILSSTTFSKAIGCFGGVVTGPRALQENRSRSGAYIGASPLPPSIAVAVLRSLEIACEHDERRRRVLENARQLKDGLRALGVELAGSPMPIAQFVVGDLETNRRVSRVLLERGVLVPYIHYPGGPADGFFRLAVTAAHTREQIARALEVLGETL